MVGLLTYAATNSHVAMGLAIFLYMWIAAGNWYMGDRWLSLMWVSYAFANIWLAADWLQKRGMI